MVCCILKERLSSHLACLKSTMKKKDSNAKANDNVESVVGEVLSNEEVQEQMALAQLPEVKALNKSIITKSNDLIQKTKYSLPRNEQKILLIMLSKIDQRNDRDASKYYTITFQEFSKLTGVDIMRSGYKPHLQQIVENLENRTFWVPDGPDQLKTISWISKGSRVNFKDKTIQMRFNPDIWKDIAQLTSNYTSYSIEYLLTMQSTYSMRIYEIVLSYDNGTREYNYTNGVIFEPVTEAVLRKFPDKQNELKGYKYKVFDMEEFKGMLSMPSKDEILRSKKSRKTESSSEPKFSREKTVSEKYKVFSDFEKNILAPVKAEINEMTDLWFDYEPVRRKGVRKYEFLYIFIKYKTKEEMKKVRAFHEERQNLETELGRKRKSRRVVSLEALEQYNLPLSETVMSMSYHMARNEVKAKAQYQDYEEKLTPEERNIFTDVFTIVGKILTSTRNPEHNKEAFNALNRIIKDNNGLKTWTFGIATRYKSLLEADGGTKTANYYRKVIFNDLIESSATTIALGERAINAHENGLNKLIDFTTVFDEDTNE